MESVASLENERRDVERALRRLSSDLRDQVKHRLLNSLENFERSFELFDRDLEMASFRAITGEEEAASCLMHAVKLQGYGNSSKLHPKNHLHKNAVMVCVIAIGHELQPILQEFQLHFDFSKARIDLKIPLSNFDVKGGESFAFQPIEPLDFLHTRHEKSDEEVFVKIIESLAEGSKFEDIKKLVADRANQRNTLLYASDVSLPSSKATREGLYLRRDRAMAMMVIAVMILQSKHQLALVKQAIPAILSVVERLPKK